jgi:hypothetical protein
MLTFLDRLIGHLAWPLLVLFVLVWYRNEIAKQFDRLTKFKAMGVEGEFAAALKEAEKKADETNLPSATSASVPLAEDKRALPELLVSKYPELAIVEAWRKTEQAASDKYGRQIGGNRVIDLPDEVRPVYEQLRQLKNRAVHAAPGTISSSEADEYVQLANRVMAQIERTDPAPRQGATRLG